MIDWHKKSDQELVALTLQNSYNFKYLMQRYEKPLLFYIRRISNFSIEEAQDILQEVYIKVYRNLNNYDPKLKFSSWIYRITHNQVISIFRKSKARPDQISYDLDEDLLNRLADEFDLQQDIDTKILAQKLLEILSKLDEKYREVIILKYFEQKDYQEISDILKKPSGTVATLLNRAKKKLKEYIQSQDIKLQ